MDVSDGILSVNDHDDSEEKELHSSFSVKLGDYIIQQNRKRFLLSEEIYERLGLLKSGSVQANIRFPFYLYRHQK